MSIINTIKLALKAITIVFSVTCLMSATTYFEKSPPPSLADHLHLSHSKDPVDRGWLADLTGLPQQDQIDLLTQNIIDIMSEDRDTKCTSINPNLRKMIFQHFAIYQQIVNAQGIYLDEKTAHQWAHLLAMVLKESSGDTTNISDMRGRSISTYEPTTDLKHWQKILNLSKQDRIQMNYQTNFGLTQISADRLFDAFKLAQDQQYDTEYLEGREGAATPRKIDLDTAIAIRRLVWFYQDFAQGRLLESDMRIHPEDIDKPEFSLKYQAGLNMALLYCGTHFMFADADQNDATFQEAMSSIAYCKLGNSQMGYAENEMEDKCFAAWITLCPALNIDIATLTPLSYFQTRNQKPVCEGTFNQLVNKNPDSP